VVDAVVGMAVPTGVGEGDGDGVWPTGDGDGVDGPLVGPLIIVGVPTGVVATGDGVGVAAGYGPTVAPPLQALSAPASEKATTATARCRKRNSGDKDVLLEIRRHRKRERADSDYIGKIVS
jgi:hypothetical protein